VRQRYSSWASSANAQTRSPGDLVFGVVLAPLADGLHQVTQVRKQHRALASDALVVAVVHVALEGVVGLLAGVVAVQQNIGVGAMAGKALVGGLQAVEAPLHVAGDGFTVVEVPRVGEALAQQGLEFPVAGRHVELHQVQRERQHQGAADLGVIASDLDLQAHRPALRRPRRQQAPHVELVPGALQLEVGVLVVAPERVVAGVPVVVAPQHADVALVDAPEVRLRPRAGLVLAQRADLAGERVVIAEQGEAQPAADVRADLPLLGRLFVEFDAKLLVVDSPPIGLGRRDRSRKDHRPDRHEGTTPAREIAFLTHLVPFHPLGSGL